MTSRSTAFPCKTLPHSGSPLVLKRLCFVTLISAVRFLNSFCMSSWLGVSSNAWESSLAVQVKRDSSALLLPVVTSVLCECSVFVVIVTCPYTQIDAVNEHSFQSCALAPISPFPLVGLHLFKQTWLGPALR